MTQRSFSPAKRMGAVFLLLAAALPGAAQEPGRYPAEVVVDPRAIYTVSLRTNARITAMNHLYPGRHVEEGENLFRFESAELMTLQKSYLATHRNMANVSEITPRVKENVTQNRLSLMWRGMSLEDIEGIEETAQPLEEIAVRAPVSGVITAVEVRMGQVVNAGVQSGQFTTVGVPVLRIAQDDSLFVEAMVPPAEAVRLAAGVPMEIEISVGWPVAGQVESVFPLVGDAVPRQRVLIRPVDRTWLHPGMRVLVGPPGSSARTADSPFVEPLGSQRGSGGGGHGDH